MTIGQLQTFVNSNPDLRQLVNVVVDYIQANPGGGSEGNASILSATITITDAQMKTYIETPVVLIPGEAGKAHFLVYATLKKNTAAGAYVTSNNNINFYYDNNLGTSILATTLAFDSIVNEVGFEVGTDKMIEVAEIENIDIFLVGAGDNYTGGHPDNTLEITGYYLVVDL